MLLQIDGQSATGLIDIPRALRAPEVSIVMPCLNEADTLASCICKARESMETHDIDGEIVVADNGSTDGSQEIARELGATVVDVADKGYGHALMGGVRAARGRFIIMGDADDSYDFGEIPKFVSKLRAGWELVQGCRLPRGGGRVMPGAMPMLHRWWGNPMFSALARWWFDAPVSDVYCGMRGFTTGLYNRLALRAPGMEFAIEMIVKSAHHGARTAEVPITLHPDGRKSHPPHLKTFRDGWRTLRFFLLHSPRWLFLHPGGVLIGLGLLGYVLALPGISLGGVNFGLNTLVFASLAILCGQQSILFAIGTKCLGDFVGIAPPDDRIRRFLHAATLERGLVTGAAALLAGLALLGGAIAQWEATNFGHLDYDQSMRWVIPGATLTAFGLQTVLSSFFISILRQVLR